MLLHTPQTALFVREQLPFSSLLDCYTDGRLDVMKWSAQRRKDDEYFDAISEHLISTSLGKSNDPPSQEERKKHQRRIILARRNEDGELEPIPPTDSLWYHLYVSCPQNKTNDSR